MGTFFGNIGNAIKGAANTAVGFAPYAARAIQQQQDRDEADKQQALAQLYALNQDRRAEMASSMAYQTGAANLARTNAQTAKIQEPTPSSVTYRPDANGNIVGLPSKVTGQRPVTPIQTGITAPPKPTPMDPVAVHASNRKFDIANPLPVRPGTGGGMNGGMGAGGIGGLARTASGITEMDQANSMMVPYENAVRTGKATFDGLDYFQGQMAKMYDAHGKVDQAIHSATFARLNQQNPDLANYLRAAEAWALADGTISGRSSDFRTRMDAFVSAIGPNAGGQHIANTQKMRLTRLDELKKFQPAMEGAANRFVAPATAGGGRGGPPPNVPHPPSAGDTPGNISLGSITPAERAALKARGFTDAQITAKYGSP